MCYNFCKLIRIFNMSLSIERFHQCSPECPENRIKYHEQRITELSRRIYALTNRIERSERYDGSYFSVTPQDVQDLTIHVADLHLIASELDSEKEGLQRLYDNAREKTMLELNQFQRDLGWTMHRLEQLQGDAERTAERGEKVQQKLRPPSPEEEEMPVHDFEEPIRRYEESDSPRLHRRRGSSPEISEDEEEEVYTPPTCMEKVQQRAEEICKAGRKWVRKNPGFAVSIALNVVLLALRKFSRSCANA